MYMYMHMNLVESLAVFTTLVFTQSADITSITNTHLPTATYMYIYVYSLFWLLLQWGRLHKAMAGYYMQLSFPTV